MGIPLDQQQTERPHVRNSKQTKSLQNQFRHFEQTHSRISPHC